MKTYFISALIIVIISFLFGNTINAQWTQIGNDIDGESAGDESGYSVSLSSDGSIVAIGAYRNDGAGADAGHVRVYEYSGTNWVQLGNDIDAEASVDQFGYSVSLSSDGTILAVGARYNDGNGLESGHVRVFEYNGSNWIKIGSDINGEAADDRSGFSVSLSSNGLIVAIGAQYNDGNGSMSGHVRVYEYSGGNWIQLGNDIDGEAADDRSGAVSINSDGTIVAIGAYANDGNGSMSGHVRVFEYSEGNWIQLGNDIDSEDSGDQFGYSVSLSSDGTILAVGAICNDGAGADAGHVRVYEYSGTNWVQLGNDIDAEASGDYLGHSVSLSSDGTILSVGAHGNSGHVRVYEYSGGNWIQLGSDMDSEDIGDQFGHSVSLSSDGTILAVGAIGNDGAGADAGHVRVFENTSVGIIENYSDFDISIYPNPTNKKINIEGNNIDFIELINSKGQLIETIKAKSNKTLIDLSKQSKGIYFVKVVTEKGVGVKKVILE